ncbi:MAG TPA: hypothetical protein VFV32_07015 [Acidimicrobiales bacterium]|jgi:hypothetical protein|nr:hypothetical protein [Acidimicrobiales bacterium]
MDLSAGPGRPLRALELRHLLTWHIHQHGTLTVRQLIGLLETDGFSTLGRPSKAVSDALRWEVGRGRIVRMGRGRYAAGRVPRTTAGRIRLRVERIYAGEATSYWAIMPVMPPPPGQEHLPLDPPA